MSSRFRHVSSAVCALLLATMPAAAQSAPAQSASGRLRPPERDEWRHRFEESRQGPDDSERISRTIKVGRGGSLDLSNVSGDIIVTGGGGDEVVIDAVKHARTRGGDSKQLLSELTVDISDRQGRVEVQTTYPRRSGGSNSAWVDFTVKVPNDAEVSLKTISGDVRVTGVQGELWVESVSGDVTTSGAGRLAIAKSVSGDVTVSGASSNGEVNVSTVSGSLIANGLKARSIEAGTVSGDLTLTDIDCERARVHTVSGAVDFSGKLARNGRYDLNSHSGDVRFTAIGGIGFELDASSFSGEVRADFPMTIGGRSDDRGRHGDSKSVRATVGDGGAIVEVRTFSGDIVIAKR